MNRYQYYTDGKEKVRKVIESCETKKQLIAARQYLRLFENAVKEMFPWGDALYQIIQVELITLEDIIVRKIMNENINNWWD